MHLLLKYYHRLIYTFGKVINVYCMTKTLFSTLLNVTTINVQFYKPTLQYNKIKPPKIIYKNIYLHVWAHYRGINHTTL